MKKWFAVIAVVMILGLVFGATQVYASSGFEQPILKKTPPPHGPGGNNPGIDKQATQQAGKDLRQAEQQLKNADKKGKKLSFRGTVASVGTDSFVLTVAGAPVTFMVDENTQIKIPTLGKNAPLTELHVGVQASVLAMEVEPGAVTSPEAQPAVEVTPSATMLALKVQVIPGKPVRIHRVGVVTAYTPDKSITIQAKDMQLYTFLLTPPVKILPADRVGDLKVGVFVTIISRRDPTGGPLSAQGIVIHPKVEESIANAPTDITLTPSTVAENLPVGTVVGALTTTDPEVGDTFTYTLVAGTGDVDNGSFTISGSNLLTNAMFNFETKSSYSIRVRTTDHGGLFFEKVLTITITNVNEAPTDIALTPSSVNEGLAVGTVVGAFTTTDPDLGDTFTYTLVAGTGDVDNGSFTISGANLLTNAVFNFATKSSYSIRVKTTDLGGLTFEKVFTITILDVVP